MQRKFAVKYSSEIKIILNLDIKVFRLNRCALQIKKGGFGKYEKNCSIF